ncbi:MAG: PIN domain-containing protein [Gaiellales bacterium]
MNEYCLDTDVFSALMRAVPPVALVRRIAAITPDALHSTAITYGEIVYGAARSGRVELVERARTISWRPDAFLPFDAAAARAYGELRVSLEREGRILDDPDLRIAAIAIARGLTVVTENVRHFSRVPGLQVENWLD